MKFLIKTFLYTFLLVIGTQAFAEQKIVVMDMKYVLNNSKAGKEAQELLKKKLESLDDWVLYPIIFFPKKY